MFGEPLTISCEVVAVEEGAPGNRVDAQRELDEEGEDNQERQIGIQRRKDPECAPQIEIGEADAAGRVILPEQEKRNQEAAENEKYPDTVAAKPEKEIEQKARLCVRIRQRKPLVDVQDNNHCDGYCTQAIQTRDTTVLQGILRSESA